MQVRGDGERARSLNVRGEEIYELYKQELWVMIKEAIPDMEYY